MSKKTWKDHLLSSGLPLEQSVRQELKRLGIGPVREYKYERPNEHGVQTVFSVDVHARVIGNPWLEFFVECKYRHDSVCWVFTPEEYDSSLDDDFYEAFIILDEVTEERVERTEIYSYSDKYFLCGKGIELHTNDANPKGIEQSIQQLRYALVEETAEALFHQVVRALGPCSPAFVLVPIVVTTAELWRIRGGVSIEDIRAADELCDVADPRTSLIVKRVPDNQFTRYTAEVLNKRLTKEQRAKFKQQSKGSAKGYRDFVSGFSRHYPSRFLVVNYSHFRNLVSNLLAIFQGQPLGR